MTTSLVINCIDVLLPVITKIINLSLESGSFASNWKCALVNPLLKKTGLDLVFKNYRPVSNVQYVSKLTERAVFNQLHEHMMANGIYPLFQSSYRQYHSTETALLRVMNDILLKMNSQHVSHDMLLDRLHNDVGLRGSALYWFSKKSASLYTWYSVKLFRLTFIIRSLRVLAIYYHKETSS